MRLFSFLIALLISISVYAADGHGEAGIPKAVFFQALNFLIFFGLLFFVLRKKVVALFKDRQREFTQALTRAEAAFAEAEQKKKEVQDRLTRLSTSADESVAKAKREAEELKARILREAEELGRTLQEETKRTVELELQKAQNELREELLSGAISAAKQVLSERIKEQDQKRLQSEFVEKIQVVR